MTGCVARSAREDDAGGGGVEVVQGIAGGKRIGWVSRAGGGSACGAASQVRLDVGQHGNGVGRGFVFQGPGLLRTVDLAEVVYARTFLGLQAGAHEIRDGDGRQNADDGDDDHDFDEGETGPFGVGNLHKQFVFSISSQGVDALFLPQVFACGNWFLNQNNSSTDDSV